MCKCCLFAENNTDDLPVANRVKLQSFAPSDYNHHLLPGIKT